MFHRSVGSERSQSVVEFALVVPLLLVLIMGIVDFGMGFGAYMQLRNATRDGARYAVVGNPAGSVTSSTIGRVRADASDLNLTDLGNGTA